jgi:Uma2 family endonuclease
VYATPYTGLPLSEEKQTMAVTSTVVTLADLLERFGPIPAARIRYDPPPGTATEQDVITLEAQDGRLFELVDGVLVEKAMGFYESYLAMRLGRFLLAFVEQHDLGIVTGEAGMLRLAPGLVHIPDVAFISWDRLPDRRIPRQPIPDLAPDLVVEVLSEGNTPREMGQKLLEYFSAGVRLAWCVLPNLQQVHVYTAPDRREVITSDLALHGGEVLAGFILPVRRLFDAAAI